MSVHPTHDHHPATPVDPGPYGPVPMGPAETIAPPDPGGPPSPSRPTDPDVEGDGAQPPAPLLPA